VCPACATLKNIAIDNADVVMQLARDGGIYTILSGMGMHRRHAAVQARCLEALHACCNQNNRNCLLMHQCKGIVALMKAMTAHRFDIDVTRAGLECLDVLAESQADEHSQFTFKLCDDAAVEVVTQAMRDHLESIEVQRAGCMTLCHFAFDDENEVKVVEMGGSREIVQALDAHAEDAEVVKAACSALKNMTVCNENKKIVAEEGGIGCIVDSLSMHSGDASVQEQGLWALANLAGHAPNRRLIGESMGVEVAVSALVTHIDNSHVRCLPQPVSTIPPPLHPSIPPPLQSSMHLRMHRVNCDQCAILPSSQSDETRACVTGHSLGHLTPSKNIHL